MSKIEINEYVRTEDGKIYEHIKDGDDYYYSSPTYFENYLEDIVKCRKKLIDLIEDKDIVEIELSEEFVEKKDKKKLIQIGDIYTKETLQKDIDNGIITRIITILSYNQYMANCYKVGGEE